MIQLVIYLVLAAGGMFAVHTLVASHDQKVINHRDAYWQPKLDAAQLGMKTATDANVGLQNSLKDIDAQRQACSAATQKLADASAAAQKRKATELAAAKANGAERAKDQAVRVADTMKPSTPGESCEAIVARRDAAIDVVGARRLRDFGVASSSGQRSGDAPASTSAGSGTLRIGK